MTYPYDASGGVPIERLPELMVLVAEAALFLMALLITLAVVKALAVWIEKDRIQRNYRKLMYDMYQYGTAFSKDGKRIKPEKLFDEQQLRERHK